MITNINTDHYIVFDPQGKCKKYFNGIQLDYYVNSYAYSISKGTWFIMLYEKGAMYSYNMWKRADVNKVPKKYRATVLILT